MSSTSVNALDGLSCHCRTLRSVVLERRQRQCAQQSRRHLARVWLSPGTLRHQNGPTSGKNKMVVDNDMFDTDVCSMSLAVLDRCRMLARIPSNATLRYAWTVLETIGPAAWSRSPHVHTSHSHFSFTLHIHTVAIQSASNCLPEATSARTNACSCSDVEDLDADSSRLFRASCWRSGAGWRRNTER